MPIAAPAAGAIAATTSTNPHRIGTLLRRTSSANSRRSNHAARSARVTLATSATAVQPSGWSGQCVATCAAADTRMNQSQSRLRANTSATVSTAYGANRIAAPRRG